MKSKIIAVIHNYLEGSEKMDVEEIASRIEKDFRADEEKYGVTVDMDYDIQEFEKDIMIRLDVMFGF